MKKLDQPFDYFHGIQLWQEIQKNTVSPMQFIMLSCRKFYWK